MTLKEKAQQYIMTEEELMEMLRIDIKAEYLAENISEDGTLTPAMSHTIDQVFEIRKNRMAAANNRRNKPAEAPANDFIPPAGDFRDDDTNEHDESHTSSEDSSEDISESMTPPDDDTDSDESTNSNDESDKDTENADSESLENESTESEVPDEAQSNNCSDENKDSREFTEDVETNSSSSNNSLDMDDVETEPAAGNTRKRKKKEQSQTELDTDIDEVPAVELRKFLAENFSVKPEKIFYLDDVGVRDKIDEKYAVIARSDKFFFIKRSYVIPVIERG